MKTHPTHPIPVMIDAVDYVDDVAWGAFTRDGLRRCVPLEGEAARMIEEALNQPATPEQGVAMTVDGFTIRDL